MHHQGTYEELSIVYYYISVIGLARDAKSVFICWKVLEAAPSSPRLLLFLHFLTNNIVHFFVVEENRRQSYKINFALEKIKSVLNSLTEL